MDSSTTPPSSPNKQLLAPTLEQLSSLRIPNFPPPPPPPPPPAPPGPAPDEELKWCDEYARKLEVLPLPVIPLSSEHRVQTIYSADGLSREDWKVQKLGSETCNELGQLLIGIDRYRAKAKLYKQALFHRDRYSTNVTQTLQINKDELKRTNDEYIARATAKRARMAGPK